MPSSFDFEPLFVDLDEEGLGRWADRLRQRASDFKSESRHGRLAEWIATIDSLPAAGDVHFDCTGGAARFSGTISESDRERLRDGLLTLRPWRKGPLHLMGIDIETEWRSDWKWDRLSHHVQFDDADVLDVGCGNGYYGWRMLDAGARRVIGIEPFPLYIAQHQAVMRYAGNARQTGAANHVIPGSDADIDHRLDAFDTAFSMGVLYHRTSPIDHLLAMHRALRADGRLVLETLVVDQAGESVLVPESRYAKMRNVWFIPSPDLLVVFLKRCGFEQIEILDVSRTTAEEQHSTEWMTFESLPDFLSADGLATIEGYPPPTRALLTATRR